MKTKLILFTCAISLLLPLSIMGGEAQTKEAEPGKKEFQRFDIKRDVKPIEPNIPEEYKPLIKAYDEYWQAIKDKEYSKAYKLESSEFRKNTKEHDYITGIYSTKEADLPRNLKKPEIQIIAARALEVKKLNEKEVMVKGGLSFKAGMMDTVRFFEDRWIKEDDAWRHVPQEVESKKETK